VQLVRRLFYVEMFVLSGAALGGDQAAAVHLGEITARKLVAC